MENIRFKIKTQTYFTGIWLIFLIKYTQITHTIK